MNKSWLIIATGLLLVLFASSPQIRAEEGDDPIMHVTFATGSVTFQVNMSVRLCEGGMQAGDIVSVPGSFNGWAPGVSVLDDLYGTGEYTGTFDIPEGDITYKFHDGDDWESTPDRMYTVVTGMQTIPFVFFDDDDVCNPPGGDVSVTFQVDLSVKMLEQNFFDPSLGEWVSVRGSFNGWGTSDTLADADGDSIYTKAITLMEGEALEYKFVIRHDDATDTWEDNIGGNRTYTVPTGGGSIPVVYFDNDAVVSNPVTQNILLKTDLQAYADMGWLRTDLGDSVHVRGAFNNWAAGTNCEDPLSILEFEYLVQNYMGFSGDNFPYKFFLDFDETSAPSRFPGWVDDPVTSDGYEYEHPAERGDGNRLYVLPNVNGNVSADVYYFSDISPDGVLYSPDACDVTFTVDMTPAIAQGFDPSMDSVKLVWEDALWRSIQVLSQGAFPQIWDMTRIGVTNMYDITFTVEGTTHYNMQYHYRFVKTDATSITEGGGLGTQCPFRSRFIQPLGAPNTFPTSYTAPTDVWDPDGAPLVCEGAYFNPLNSVELEPDLGQPVAYKLVQNYPNPFNPATRIKYSIPERAQVTLKVFNVLGQEVASLVNEIQEQGNYVALFEANKLSSGVYFYKLEAGKFSQSKKMVLMK